MSETPERSPENADSQQGRPFSERLRSAWAWPTVWIVFACLMFGSGIFIFKSLRDIPVEMLEKTESVLEKTTTALAEVASAFHQGTVTTSFVSYATSLTPTTYLQFATLRQMEVFTQSDQTTTAFGYLPLPEVIVEARAPIEYTYFLDLNGNWEFILQENVVYVVAPRIQFNKPAIDASKIEYEVKKGSILRKTSQAQENLKQSLTLLAHQKGRENLHLVRDTGRKQVADYVEKWLVKTFADGRQYPVKVYFEDEKLPGEIALAKKPVD